MKILFLIISYFCLSGLTFSQNKYPISKNVEEFFDTLNVISKDYDQESHRLTKFYSHNEINNLAKKYYKAILEDPIGYDRYILNESTQFSKNRKAGLNSNEITPQLKRGIFFNLLEENLGKEFTKIISIPYFLRVKIENVTHSKYTSSVDSMKFTQTNLNCEIEEIIKGEKRFQTKTKVVISYLNWWLKDCSNNSNSNDLNDAFKVNSSYFIPIKPRFRGCTEDTCITFALQILPDNNCGIYPIINGTIYTPNNYFQISMETQWSNFKNSFIKKYVLPLEGE